MATNPSAEELYTTIENISGVERFYGFLGPRGMRLAAGEVVTIPGDLISSLGHMAQYNGKRRAFDAMERALKAGDLQINSRPAPVLYDSEDELPRSIAVVGGVLGVVNPYYNEEPSSSSSSA